VSNQKAKFVPREHEIYHRITPYVIVFDVAGDFDHIIRVIWSYHPGDMIRVNHARRSRKQGGRQNILKSDELLSF
jgi:hypothetical protein